MRLSLATKIRIIEKYIQDDLPLSERGQPEICNYNYA